MNEDAELNRLREQVTKLERHQVKVARRRVWMFGTIAIAGLISGVYGFVQHEAATRCQEQAIGLERLALQRMGEAMAARDRAEGGARRVKELTAQLEACQTAKK